MLATSSEVVAAGLGQGSVSQSHFPLQRAHPHTHQTGRSRCGATPSLTGPPVDHKQTRAQIHEHQQHGREGDAIDVTICAV